MSDQSYNTAPTVDPKEVEYFEAFTAKWWDSNDLKGLKTMSVFWMKVIQDRFVSDGLVSKELVDTPMFFKDKLILDVGCGGGFLSERLAQTGAKVTGLDIHPGLIKVAKEHAALDSSLTNLTYILEPIEQHCSNNPEKYDMVVTSFVLEHVKDHELFLQSCIKCLKPGGSLFLSCVSKTTACWLVAIVLYEIILRIIPRGMHNMDKCITVEDTQAIIEKYDCKVKYVRGAHYNLFTTNWSLIGNTSIFYLLQAVKNN